MVKYVARLCFVIYCFLGTLLSAYLLWLLCGVSWGVVASLRWTQHIPWEYDNYHVLDDLRLVVLTENPSLNWLCNKHISA